jgi:hypothetical protein
MTDMMRIFTPEDVELMCITGLERDGGALLVKGKIMGTMPMKAHLRPEEIRKLLRLLDLPTLLFLLTLPFRRGVKRGS